METRKLAMIGTSSWRHSGGKCRGGKRRGWGRAIVLVLWGLLLLVPLSLAVAQEGGEQEGGGQEQAGESAPTEHAGNPKEQQLLPFSGWLLARGSGVNLRHAPSTKSEILGLVKAGQRVRIDGRVADSDWFAVTDAEGTAGFVYGPVMTPMIEGRVEQVLRGRAEGLDGRSCDFSINFEGRSTVEDSGLVTADYWVDLLCANQSVSQNFKGFLFITEVAPNPKAPGVFQLNMELFEIGLGYEEVLTTVLLYEPTQQTLRTDGAYPAQLMRENINQEPVQVETLAAALIATVQLSVASWGEAAWQQIREL